MLLCANLTMASAIRVIAQRQEGTYHQPSVGVGKAEKLDKMLPHQECAIRELLVQTVVLYD